MEWVALIGTVLSFVLWAVRQAEAAHAANAPVKLQQETDADLTNPDPEPLAVRLSRLLDKARARRRPPQ